MLSIFYKNILEYLENKLTHAGWLLTCGNWEENFSQNIGQELVWEDETRLIIVSYPNLFSLDVNPYQHISILLNDKLHKKYVEFGFVFNDVNKLDKSLETIFIFQNTLSLTNIPVLIKELRNFNFRLTWESQGQILEEINSNNIYTERFSVHQ
jgi:hypothetical protein